MYYLPAFEDPGRSVDSQPAVPVCYGNECRHDGIGVAFAQEVLQ